MKRTEKFPSRRGFRGWPWYIAGMNLFCLVYLFFSIAFSYAQDGYYSLGGQHLLIPKLGSHEPLPSHPRFNGFIQQKFNRPGDFHGTNCYNTALISSGVYPTHRLRYVSPEEFEAVLRTHFKPVQAGQFQDLVVFDSKNSRGHAAYYLGDELIFHKKSHGTHYHYRITHLSLAGVVEENERRPGPVDDSSAQMDWPQLGNLPMTFYRLSSRQALAFDPRLAAYVNKLESLLLNDLKVWAIARKWGLTGEFLLEDLLQYARAIKSDPYTIGVIISMKDQLYTMIEEVYFKRARSASKVMEEICLPEQKEQLYGLVRELGKLMQKDDQKLIEILSGLEAQDRSKCRLHPFPG